MPDAISNTSPLFYLHRIGVLEWLPALFGAIWVPQAVCDELLVGREIGHDTPYPSDYAWIQIVNPRATPSEWLSLDLGPGELAAMALALENPTRVILLDDSLARRTALAAGLTVWGTLKVLLEAKASGLTDKITPHVDHLSKAGMWLSKDIRQRIIAIANET
jgi:predicted nucleic acid-binding protein